MRDGLRDYLKRRGVKLTPVNPEAVRVYNESMAKLLPKIEADIKAQRRAAHFFRIGVPDPLQKRPKR